MNAHGDSIWKLCIGVSVLIVFMGLGIGHMLFPDYFIERSGLRHGGEMLTDSNRTGVQFVGLIATLFSGGILYELLKDVFSK
jgi:hypothetical protein